MVMTPMTVSLSQQGDAPIRCGRFPDGDGIAAGFEFRVRQAIIGDLNDPSLQARSGPATLPRASGSRPLMNVLSETQARPRNVAITPICRCSSRLEMKAVSALQSRAAVATIVSNTGWRLEGSTR